MSYRDDYVQSIERNFYDLENRIIADIVRRIKKTGDITSTADWQIGRLAALGYSSAEIEDAIKKALNATCPEMFELYDRVIQQEYVRNKDLYEQINDKFIPYKDNHGLQRWLSAVKNQTEKTMENLTGTLGVVDNIGGQLTFLPLASYCQKTLDAAVYDIASGAFDYNSVLKRTVNTLAKSGIRTIDYASGHSSRLPVAVRRAVMTGLSQITGKIAEMDAEELGTEYFEIDWHEGARPSHRAWQGKVWSKDELVSVCGLGTVTGLKGANCYHDYYPFLPGISERMYTDQWLAAQNRLEDTPRAYRGKGYTAYEARQKQRQMEASMRAQRQKVRGLEAGGAAREDIVIAKARYQGQLAEYKQFSDAMKLKPHMERVYIDGLGRIAPGRRPMIIANTGRSGIINKAKGTGVFQSINVKTLSSKTDISIKNIKNEMLKSRIGRETLEQIESSNVIIQALQGVKPPDGERGEQQGNIIKIYLDNIANERVAARTVIHEMTHFYYDIGNCQWAEAVCFAKEKMHIEGRNKLTVAELRYVVQLAKDHYGGLSWKKGGYRNGKHFTKY